jgi:cytidylate kinase
MEKTNKKLTIAIDGHSSCGKSTAAKDLAKALDYTYIDSGAMYRSVTLLCMDKQLINGDIVDEAALKHVLADFTVHFTFDSQTQKYLTWMNNQMVEDRIRSIELANQVSLVSKIGFVRTKLVKMQQAMGQQGGIVMDGRDIGTVVFPDAELKIFMTASAKVRAQRRYDELSAEGHKLSFDEVLANIEKRDFIDENREIAPLRKADDAIVIDNSYLTREEQLEKIIDLVKQRIK